MQSKTTEGVTNTEQAHYKKLRAQYKKFLEEDRKRQERNEKIIRTLERIESRVNMLTSKTERVKLLRRQYQNYLQRVSQKPTEKREYYPPKIAEELPTDERNHSSDYSKKSCNIAMLKKAHGKTNEEKIEILDKYLQSLKSQKEPTVTEIKPNDLNELKYFDEVSKKLNEGFNSNEANSIAEEIMNSIYARHYKPDLFKDERKKVSKFTCPSTVGFSDKDRNRGIGDSNYNNGLRYNFSSDAKLSPNINREPVKIDDTSYPMPKANFKVLEKSKESYGFGNSADNSKSEIDLKENEKQDVFKSTLTKTNYNDILTKNKESQSRHVDDMSRLVDSNRPSDIHKVIINNPVENTKTNEKSTDNDLPQKFLTEVNVPYVAEDKQRVDTPVLTTTETSEAEGPIMQKNDNKPQRNPENEIEKPKTPENDTILQNNVEPADPNENGSDIQEIIEPHAVNENMDPQPGNVEEDVQELATDERNSQKYYNKHNENEQLYEQTNQYNFKEEPIEQLYDEDSNALDQCNEKEQLDLQNYEYNKEIQQVNDVENNHGNVPVQQCDENGQAIQSCDEYGQQYNENGQPIQHYDENSQQYDENGQLIQQISENSELIPRYDENSQPIHENEHYDENSQHIQQHYDETGQPVQNFDESGQPIQQYDERNQPMQHYDQNGQLDQYGDQQYDENGQPLLQYDENGQPLLQYDENGQPLVHYDENGQVISQYDESGQPINQYDDSGQVIQQYDENGQPIYLNQEEQLVRYDENGQLIQQYDENGQPIVSSDPYQQYDVTGQPLNEEGQILQQYEENQYGESDQVVEQSGKSDLPEQQQHVEGEVAQPPKKSNVLDLLDTDSESVKQNTSKITNDSDFDFSNG